MAKGFVAEAAVFISGEDIQIHGGVGFTWDCDAHLYYKRAKMNDAMLGYQGWQRRRLADLVLDERVTRTGRDKFTSLHDAVAEHVRSGDALHIRRRAHPVDAPRPARSCASGGGGTRGSRW